MAKEKTQKVKREPTILEAISLLVFMIIVFSGGVLLGMNYVPLVMCVAFYAIFIAIRCGYTWDEIYTRIKEKISKGLPMLTIFLIIGALTGALMFSGTLPYLIYYGTKIISARWLYLCAFILCVIFSTLTGTSNGSVTTVGLAMMGIGWAMEGVNLGLLAGAIVEGAVFGDKLSPLSDTTLMAAAVTDNDVYDHVAHQFRVVGPAAVISIIIYIIIGLTSPLTGSAEAETTIALQNDIQAIYNMNILLLLPFVIVILGVVLKWDSNGTLVLAAVAGLILGCIFQGGSAANAVKVFYEGFNPTMLYGEELSSITTSLLKRGGMTSMTKPFLTVFLCFHFAGAAELPGTMRVLVDCLRKLTNSRFGLMLTAGLSMVVLESLTGSSTPAQSVAGPLFKEKYEEKGIHTLNLARTLEDFGTGTTGFIPWTSSGQLYASTLQVTNGLIFKYAFFGWLVYLIDLFYAATGIGVMKLDGSVPGFKKASKKAE